MKPMLATLVAATLALAGCGKHEAAPAPGRTPVRFATDWLAEAEQGGFYEAVANGEYAKRGLDVTILSGGPGTNVPQLVAAGAAQMGVGSNSFIVMNLAAQGVPVKAVAAFMQKDPQVLIAHPNAGVEDAGRSQGPSDPAVRRFGQRVLGLAQGQVRPQ